MSPAERSREPPIYRPFALLAFAATVAGGTPLGIWMLFGLHLGAPAVPIHWILLHAHLQIFGFFGTLIPGVAHHLFPRFTGRPVARHPLTRWLAGLLGAALVLRISGTWSHAPSWILTASLLQATAFVMFASWVWRSLDPPQLALLRRHLTVSTGWLVVACLFEAALRGDALRLGLLVPSLGGMRAVHAMGIFGGVVGWVLGVMLRAGPMFVPNWSAPLRLARALPWLLALGVSIAVTGEVGDWIPSTATALARLGELIALGVLGAVAIVGGGFRRTPRALPIVSRSPQEARIFRLAMLSAGVAALGSAVAAAAAWSGIPVPLLADALRHLVTVGFLTAVVMAMAFRLIPVLEGTALPWPGLRPVAFWALLGGVLLRSGEVLVGYGWRGIAPWVPLSGVLVWIALASVGANLVGAVVAARRAT